MASENDSVSIDKQAASTGLFAWEATTDGFVSQFDTLLSTIRSTHAKVPWGSDSAGSQFAAAYEKGLQFPDSKELTDVISALKNTGPATRTAIEQNLQADEAQGQEIDKSAKAVEGARTDV